MKNTFHGVFFLIVASVKSVKTAVIMPLKYNSDTYHFVKFVLLQMEKNVLNPEHMVLFSSILLWNAG